MTIRRRNDSVKPGAGIDGTKGEDFSKPHGSGTSEFYKDVNAPERSYSPNSKRTKGDQWLEVGKTDPGLRNVPDFGYSADSRDIWSDACEGNGETNSGFSGPVRYGVNKPQGSKR
jgi:hypothetical protein